MPKPLDNKSKNKSKLPPTSTTTKPKKQTPASMKSKDIKNAMKANQNPSAQVPLHKNKPIKTADEYQRDMETGDGDDSDESIDSDEDWNSDDERKWGGMFKGNKSKGVENGEESGSDEGWDEDDDDDNERDEDDSEEVSGSEDDDEDSVDDCDDEDDGGQFMLDMLNNIDKPTTNNDPSSNMRKESSKTHSGMKEGEFKSTSTNSLSLDMLINPLTSSDPSLRKLQSSLSSRTTAQAPLATHISDKASRQIMYANTSSDISNWTDVVKSNREAETLDFRPKNRARTTVGSVVNKFEADGDFEQRIESILKAQKDEDSNNSSASESEDDDDLGRSKLTMEEYKKRHGQLSKLRSLMFYDEIKRHKINKIKSKKYRKIRSKASKRLEAKELEALKESDPEEYERVIGEEAKGRVEERMSLSHKNTSKWARAQLRRGKGIDGESRKMLGEQLRVGDQLRRKQTGGESGSDSDSSGGESDGEGGKKDDFASLKRKAQRVLDSAGQEEGEVEKSRSGLFNLEFMKRGLDNSRKKAVFEAKELLKELNEDERMANRLDPDYSDNDEGGGEEKVKNVKNKKAASESEVKGLMEEGLLTVKKVNKGFSEEGDMDIGGAGGWNDTAPDTSSVPMNKKKTKAAAKEKERELDGGNFNVGVVKRKVVETEISNDNKKKADPSSNPWVLSEKQQNLEAKASKRSKLNGATSQDSVVTFEDGVRLMNSTSTSFLPINGLTTEGEDGASKKVNELSQEELVKRAFASPEDIEAEFREEKQREIDEEIKRKKGNKKGEDEVLDGWGSWAGIGVKPPKKKKATSGSLGAPKKKPEEKPSDRRDARLSTVFINEKRIKKVSSLKLASVPYPFTSAEQYEASLRGAVGKEWNVTSVVKDLTRRDVITRSGQIIQPISKANKVKNKGKGGKGGRQIDNNLAKKSTVLPNRLLKKKVVAKRVGGAAKF